MNAQAKGDLSRFARGIAPQLERIVRQVRPQTCGMDAPGVVWPRIVTPQAEVPPAGEREGVRLLRERLML